MDPSLALAQLLCSRLCHDLGGPLGSVTGALELLDDPAGEAAEVARDAARLLERRLRLYRAALGSGVSDTTVREISPLMEALTSGRRVQVDGSGLEQEALVPALLTQVLLVAAWLGTEALPRGGVVAVSGDPARELVIWPQGPGASWPAGLLRALAGEDAAPEPRTVLAPLLVALAARAGCRVALAMGLPGPGAPPLLVIPQGGG
jgi:histidine phosphotransferase ChpT